MSNQYSLCWKHGDLKILHPRRGLLPVQNQKGCPQLPRALALDLIEETMRSLKFEKEQKWMQELIQSHPVLRELPQRIQDRLLADVGGWKDLPISRRQRKRLQRDSCLVHLYAGEDDGFTLFRALKQQGGNTNQLLEIDLKRGEFHNMLNDVGTYSGLLCAVMHDKVDAFIAGPNWRTRSVFRHYPKENAPRPI